MMDTDEVVEKVRVSAISEVNTDKKPLSSKKWVAGMFAFLCFTVVQLVVSYKGAAAPESYYLWAGLIIITLLGTQGGTEAVKAYVSRFSNK
jgi:uncharacterized membrane protein